MWQREILIFTEISWSLPPSLHFYGFLSCIPLSVFYPSQSSASLFLLRLPTFISVQPTFSLFLWPPLSPFTFSLPSPSPPTPPPCIPLSLWAFTLSYYHSLCIPPPSSSLCHSGRAAGRQRQHTLMLLYLTRHTHTHTHTHTHILLPHARLHKHTEKKKGRWGHTHTHTQTCRHTGKTALKCTCVDKQTHTRAHTHTNTLRRVLSAGITNIATHTQKG